MKASVVVRIPVIVRADRSTVFSFAEPKRMRVVRLAELVIALTCDVADKLVSVKTYRTNVVRRLTISRARPESKQDIALTSLKKLIPAFLSFEFVLSQQFLTNLFQCVTKLNIRHVCQRQFTSERVQKLRCFIAIKCLFTVEETLDGADSRRRFAGQPYSIGSESKRLIDNREVHFVLQAHPPQSKAYSRSTATRKKAPGVVPNLLAKLGTGGGSTAQERLNLSF
jgi:hypothetical protein